MLCNINLITTIIGFGMSSCFIAFVCTRLICGRLRLAEARRAVDRGSEIDIEQPVQRTITNGLEPAVVAAIPTMKFHHDAFSSWEDAQCSICLGEYQEKEVLRIMPKCGHNFHLSCIDIWLTKQSTCPVCRLPLKDSSGRKCVRVLSVNVALSDDDDAGTMREHLDQSSYPGSGHSAGNDSSQQHMQSTSRNPEPILAGES